MEWSLMWTRHYGVQYFEVIFLAYSKKLKHSRILASEINIAYPKNGANGYFKLRKDFESTQKKINNMDDFELENKIKKLNISGKKFVEISKNIGEMELEKLEGEKLYHEYEKFRRIWIEYTVILSETFLIGENIAKKAQKIISEREGKYTKEELELLTNFISTPTKRASINKLNKQITALKKEGNEKKIRKILIEYAWMPCLDIHNAPWGKSEIDEYIINHEIKEEILLDGNLLFEKFKLNDLERKIAIKNKKWAYVRDLRDEYRRKGMKNIRGLYKEIGKRIGIIIDKVSYVTETEIKNFLLFEKSIDFKKIEDRIKGFAMIEHDGKITLTTGNDIKKLANKFGFTHYEKENGKIVGLIASKGVAIGRAKIIYNVLDLGKIEKGDILIAVTTHPNYIVAMQKAAAFVTDEGSITCHAAIIAREMKKPCIVGTKNATSEISDGDLIEVDAKEGIIRKI